MLTILVAVDVVEATLVITVKQDAPVGLPDPLHDGADPVAVLAIPTSTRRLRQTKMIEKELIAEIGKVDVYMRRVKAHRSPFYKVPDNYNKVLYLIYLPRPYVDVPGLVNE